MRIDIHDDIFALSKIEDLDTYFPGYVNAFLKRYIDFCSHNHIPGKLLSNIQEFAKNIYTCLIEYGCGQRASAKYYFDIAINNIDFKDICCIINNDIFYRARIVSEEDKEKNVTKLGDDDMFHVPLEKRYLVSTQRYSYPGLPCLYLGSSYEVCCAELNNWDNDLNIAVIEKNRLKEIAVLDLLFFEKYQFDKLSNLDFERFIRFWPLVACCSMTYEYTEKMKFRQDYIIPQLLLEYIIDKNADNCINGTEERIYGIRYGSVKNDLLCNEINLKRVSSANYVFPVLSNQSHGYCHILRDFFHVKKVYLLSELVTLDDCGH